LMLVVDAMIMNQKRSEQTKQAQITPCSSIIKINKMSLQLYKKHQVGYDKYYYNYV
jgi:hypothetical protein